MNAMTIICPYTKKPGFLHHNTHKTIFRSIIVININYKTLERKYENESSSPCIRQELPRQTKNVKKKIR